MLKKAKNVEEVSVEETSPAAKSMVTFKLGRAPLWVDVEIKGETKRLEFTRGKVFDPNIVVKWGLYQTSDKAEIQAL